MTKPYRVVKNGAEYWRVQMDRKEDGTHRRVPQRPPHRRALHPQRVTCGRAGPADPRCRRPENRLRGWCPPVAQRRGQHPNQGGHPLKDRAQTMHEHINLLARYFGDIEVRRLTCHEVDANLRPAGTTKNGAARWCSRSGATSPRPRAEVPDRHEPQDLPGQPQRRRQLGRHRPRLQGRAPCCRPAPAGRAVQRDPRAAPRAPHLGDPGGRLLAQLLAARGWKTASMAMRYMRTQESQSAELAVLLARRK
jgi:hypothetical protein